MARVSRNVHSLDADRDSGIFRTFFMKPLKQFSRFERREAPSVLNRVIGKLSKHWMTLVDGNKWRRIR